MVPLGAHVPAAAAHQGLLGGSQHQAVCLQSLPVVFTSALAASQHKHISRENFSFSPCLGIASTARSAPSPCPRPHGTASRAGPVLFSQCALRAAEIRSICLVLAVQAGPGGFVAPATRFNSGVCGSLHWAAPGFTGEKLSKFL